MNAVKPERTGWRDAALSERHREWGFNCPAVDLDFLMLEYNSGKPSALVEYKRVGAAFPDPSHATYRALVDLANGYRDRPLPCFVAIYDPETWAFYVIPLNVAGEAHFIGADKRWITEQDFVRRLHLMRKDVLTREDEDAISRLCSERPAQAS